MKVRHELPAHKGNNGKQGGERFRTILKYPIAADILLVTKKSRDMVSRHIKGKHLTLGFTAWCGVLFAV